MQRKIETEYGDVVIISNKWSDIKNYPNINQYDLDVADYQYDNYGYFFLDPQTMSVIDDEETVEYIVSQEGKWH